MTSNAKSIHENQILTYQMQGCGKNGHYKSRFIPGLSTHTIQLYSTKLHWCRCEMLYLICTQIVERGLQIIVVKERTVWVPLFDINQFFDNLNSSTIIIHITELEAPGVHFMMGLYAHNWNCVKIFFCCNYVDPIRSQVCTCHNSSDAMTCAKLWPYLIITF